jgi:hypothetical protein
LISIITWLGLETKIEMAPFTPAGTTAAFATICPPNAFNVETFGRAEPAGQAVKNWSGPGGTTVMFSEYARAVDGIPQELNGIGTSR